MTMNNPRIPTRRRASLVRSLILPTIALLLLGAGSHDAPQLARNRREIKKMTPSQRAQLDRNFHIFLGMTSEQRQHLRDLDRKLQTDENAETLRVTLDRYRSWLKTLSPFQREELRSIENLDERVERVRQFKAQQSAPAPLSDEAPRISPQDLAAVMNAITEDLEIAATKLDGKSDWQRHMLILNTLVEKRRGQIRPRDWKSLFDDDLMAKMIAALPAGEFRDAIADVRFKDVERQMVAGNIAESLGRELEKNIVGKRPNAMQLKRMLFRMNSDDRRRYEELESQDEKDRFVLRRYRVMATYEMLRPYPALRPVFASWLSARHGGLMRPDSYPRRGGRDSDRQPPDGKPPFRPQGGPPRGFRRGEGRPRKNADRPQ